MKNTKLKENIKIHKLLRLLIIPKGVGSIGSFRIVLAAGVLVEILIPASKAAVSPSPSPSLAKETCNIREAAMRRYPLKQTQSNFQKFMRGFRFEAFVLQILEMSKKGRLSA
jgi:hypothetical protein